MRVMIGLQDINVLIVKKILKFIVIFLVRILKISNIISRKMKFLGGTDVSAAPL